MNIIDQVRSAAMGDLYTFSRLVNPQRLYGDIHKKVFKWISKEGEGLNQLLLLPRGHMKSHVLAMWCAWWITKHPEVTILYISATAELAEKQLYDIKNVLSSPIYKMYWPEMIDPEEGKREKWAATKIAVDHPRRKEEGIRDWTVATAGLVTNTTGWHADVIVPDDVVVPDNAYTEEGRRKTSACMSQLVSIKNAGGLVKACGTRYHPADQYSIWKNQKEILYDDEFNITGEQAIWEVFEEKVEENGKFLWPREVRADGKSFGFDVRILSRIKGEYTDVAQFYAQYYNDPNDPDSARMTNDKFQYYDQKFLKCIGGRWFFKEEPLNLVAAIDFAYSLSNKADYTSIVVIGTASTGDIYILDIDRFRSDKITYYMERIIAMNSKWGFRKLVAEVNAAQQVIVGEIKDKIKENGLSISIDSRRPNRHEGSKQERIAATLEPKYESMSMWHYRGGYTPVLEEELLLARPPHDDIKETLASAVSASIKPKSKKTYDNPTNVIQFNSRFGGVTH